MRLLICLILPLWSLWAQPVDPAPYIKYVNDIKTVKSEFIQINPDGSMDEGIFYLSRPGLMRLDYAAPNALQLVARDQYLVQYNRETKEANYLALGDTPASVLLQPEIKIGKDIRVEEAVLDKGFTRLRLRKETLDGYLDLIFTPEPTIQLQQWVVVDASDNRTRVTLQNQQTGVAFPKELFKYPG